MSGFPLAGFPLRKALSSNHLGNSLGINIVKTGGKPGNFRFGDLHISGVPDLPVPHSLGAEARLECGRFARR